MKFITFSFVFIWTTFISQSIAISGQNIEEEAAQRTHELQQISSNMQRQLRDPYRIYSEEQKSRIQARKEQSRESFKELKDQAFIDLQNTFDEYSDVAFQQMRTALLGLAHEAEVKVYEWISFFQNNGGMATEGIEIQNIYQDIHSTVFTMQQLTSRIDYQYDLINTLRTQTRQLESQNCENNDINRRNDLLSVYSQLKIMMNQWKENILCFGKQTISIADKLEYALPEKIKEWLRNR